MREKNGERWRFSLAERARLRPDGAVDITRELASFTQSQFGVETLSSYGWWQQQDPDSAKGILEVDTLAEDECLAKTSDGVRRFKLPAAHHFIAPYRSVFDKSESVSDSLVQIFLNRRQYDKAREALEQTIASYFKASGEDAPEMDVEILLDGKSLKKVSINRDNLFTFDGTAFLSGEAVTTRKHVIELKKTGKGTLYANAYLEVFTLEDKLRAAGLEVKVQRKISKLIELEEETEAPDATGLIVKQQAERFRREPLTDGTSVKSGDRIEVELILESKNDYEYLIFSDAKAAGFEALDALSGYISGDCGFSAYIEPRDQSVNFFIRALPRGTHTLRYQLRAEAPGS